MGLAGSGAEPGLVSRIWPHLGAAWGGIREGKVPVPTLVRKGAPWCLLHGLLVGGRNGDGRIWEMGISTRRICPPLRDNNFSIHPPSEGFSSSGLKVLPKTSTPIISRLQPPPALPNVVLGDPNHPHGTSPWSPGLEGAAWC